MSERVWSGIVYAAVFLLLTPIMSGCSMMAARSAPENTSYVKGSQGEAGGVVKAVSGGASYCMLHYHSGTFGIKGRIIWTPEGGCQVQADVQQ
jgi:hypothetical protein